MKVLATGATGSYAGLVVSALAARGIEVRAMVHDPAKADIARGNGAAGTVQADLADRASLDAALKGIDGAFLITPAFAPDATRLGLNMVEAAVEADLGKLVYSGVYHPSLPLENHASTRPIEAAIYASGLDFTILQPAMYLQGLDSAYEQALRTGSVVMPWSKRAKMTYVDLRDLADAAAIAFADARLSRGTFELAAGGMIDRIELAALMSRAAGKPLVAADMAAGALPPDQAEGLSAMFAYYDRHGLHGGNALALRTILRREPRSVADYVEELGQHPRR